MPGYPGGIPIDMPAIMGGGGGGGGTMTPPVAMMGGAGGTPHPEGVTPRPGVMATAARVDKGAIPAGSCGAANWGAALGCLLKVTSSLSRELYSTLRK